MSFRRRNIGSIGWKGAVPEKKSRSASFLRKPGHPNARKWKGEAGKIDSRLPPGRLIEINLGFESL
jgi:hypothetical protein